MDTAWPSATASVTRVISASGRATARRMFLQAPSWVFRPTLLDGPQGDELREVQHDDPDVYLRDYGAQFGKAGGAYYTPQEIDGAMRADRPFAMEPERGREYYCWIDQALKCDLFAAAIGYRDDNMVVYPVVTWWEPKKGAPLDDKEVAKELAAILRAFGIDRLKADQWGDIAFANDLALYGIRLETEAKTNQESNAMHSNFKAGMRRGILNIPKHDMIRKDVLACRQTGKGNAFKVAAPQRKGFHDDITKVLAALAQDLLPLGTAVDLEALNAGAVNDRDRLFKERGFPLPEDPERLPTNIMGQVF